MELVSARRLEPEMPSDVMGDIDVPLVPAGKDALLDSLVEAGPEITVFSHTFTPTDNWADILFTPGNPEIPARQFNTIGNVLAEVVFYSGGMLSLLALVLLASEARYVTPPGQRPASKWRWRAFGLVAGIMATAFFVTAEDVVWIDSSLIPRAGAGEKETILSLSQAWMKSILALRGS